ncbi:MAG: hypothetical protein JWO78_1085 [Micavibrio sp.]|nr:hypothetical protein [Micavibrio sp.]
MINAIQIALSGLNAAKTKADTVASNIANTRTEGALDPANGPAPYGTLTTTQSAQGNGGVSVTVVPTVKPYVPAYNPDSPFANADGQVGVPNTDYAAEFVNLQIASTSYKANVKTIQISSDMQKDLLAIFDKKA